MFGQKRGEITTFSSENNFYQLIIRIAHDEKLFIDNRVNYIFLTVEFSKAYSLQTPNS